MNKFIVSICLLFLACGIFAAEKQPVQKNNADWDFITCTFVPGVPPEDDVLDVYGVKIGVPVGFASKAKVVGVELSIFASTSVKVYGLQSAVIFNKADFVDGLQASFIYNVAKNVHGIQFSFVNVAEDTSFQIGLLNFIKNSPLKCFPFVNCKF